MPTYSLNLGGLEQAEQRFRDACAKAGGAMKARLDAAADEARSSHGYQDRTGTLSRETKAGPLQSTDDGHVVELGAFTDYAEYVDEKGLMSLGQAAEKATADVRGIFEGIGELI